MVKYFFLASFFFFPSLIFPFTPLPEEYLIAIGNPQATIKIVEYFSLGCPSCLDLIRKDFETIYRSHIQKGKVYWTFHPDPQDLTTLRFLVCLRNIPQAKRLAFFWDSITTISPGAEKRNCFFLQELSQYYGYPVPHLEDLNYLENTQAAQAAFLYLKQKDIPDIIPAIEKNGVLLKDIPNLKHLQEALL